MSPVGVRCWVGSGEVQLLAGQVPRQSIPWVDACPGKVQVHEGASRMWPRFDEARVGTHRGNVKFWVRPDPGGAKHRMGAGAAGAGPWMAVGRGWCQAPSE